MVPSGLPQHLLYVTKLCLVCASDRQTDEQTALLKAILRYLDSGLIGLI